jgi:3-dehydroquinate dehydratase
MNTFKKLYRDFFGLREAKITVDTKNPNAIKAAQDIANDDPTTELHFEEANAELDEAQLINKITDYRGGVEYVLRNPAEAKQVSIEIRQWAEKKGFVVIKQKISNNGKVGYFYFKLGQDPALESQKIQGYVAQKPEVKHFRFNVRGQKPQSPQTEI